MDAVSLLDRLRAIVGPAGLLTDPADTAPYCTDWRGLFHGRTPAVVRPANTEEVAAVVRLCGALGLGIVPQGGNTSMVGGATPSEDGSQIVLNLARMNRVIDVDPVDMTLTAQAGVTLKAAQQAAGAAGCWLPLSIASEGSAQLGGVLAVNAGGNNTLRFGNARDLCLGIEAVMADGGVLSALRRLRKDNTGYALRHLLIGSEGTLGIITACVLKLVPAPAETAVALCTVADEDAALALLVRTRRDHDAALVAFEYMSGAGVDLVLRHIPGVTLPLSARADHYCLIELSSPRANAGLRLALEATLEAALDAGEIGDAALAESEAQRAAIWRLREEHSEAQKRAGASVKNDVSVPVSRVPDLIRQCSAAVTALVPGCVPVPFGHLGDGNIHMNFSQPPGGEAGAFLTRGEEIMHAVNAVVRELGGSFSAEHGVGRLKGKILAEWRGGAELAAMRAVKGTLDPGAVLANTVLPPLRV
jgi:FAD/FMN-containing dehydrogenase